MDESLWSSREVGYWREDEEADGKCFKFHFFVLSLQYSYGGGCGGSAYILETYDDLLNTLDWQLW